MWYVGILAKDGTYEAFTCDNPPTRSLYGSRYTVVIGPFRTKRAALWAERYGRGNPHFQTVEDAERLSREQHQ